MGVKPALAGRPTAPKKGTRQPLTDAEVLGIWGRWASRKDKNRNQERVIYKAAKDTSNLETRGMLLKAAAALYWCGRRQIVEQRGTQYVPVGAYNCGKKYCSHCSRKKRNKILSRFAEFFKSDAGTDILRNYDLALFTVTLSHNKTGKRSTPYYKELSTHFRNALKYGSFKDYIAGGFYNTEHTYGKNGHHIHRHALVLIPRQYDVITNFKTIEEKLRKQWKERTGDSFHVDLRPLGYDENTRSAPPRNLIQQHIVNYLLEVTKYITKRDKGTGAIPVQVVAAVEQFNRSKFYGRFGILHRVKALNLNIEEVEIQEAKEPRTLYIGTPYVHLRKKRYASKIIKNHIKHQIDAAGRETTTVRKEIQGEAPRWEKFATSYQMKDLVPMADTREAAAKFKEDIRNCIYEWKREKWSKLCEGMTVDKWKEQKKAYRRFIDKLDDSGIIRGNSDEPDPF